MTNSEHNKFLALAFIGHGSFQLIVTMLILTMFGLIFNIPDPPGGTPPSIDFLLVLFGFVFIFQMLFVAPSFIAAYALIKRKPWARIASIVAGVIAAMNVPFGTLACVYSFWFFLGENWKTLYCQRPEGMHDSPLLGSYRETWTGYRTNEQGEMIFHTVEPPDWR